MLYPKKVVPIASPHKLKRRDAPMIVKTYLSDSGAVVHIDDSYAARTEEEREKVEQDIIRASWPILDELEGA